MRAHMLDVAFINPFLSAVVDVFKTMAMTVADPQKPYLKEDDFAHGDITGIIGVTGVIKGTIAVSFTAECAMALVGDMLGEEMREVNAGVKDGVGELTNMISGQARKGLAEAGYKLHAAIPVVITGHKHIIPHASPVEPVLAIPFTTLFGPVTVEVCFAPLKGGSGVSFKFFHNQPIAKS